MTRKYVVALIIILIIFFLYSYRGDIEGMLSRNAVCNSIDGRCYEVIEYFSDKEKASEYLAEINKFIVEYLRYLRKKYIWEKKGTAYRQEMVRLLLAQYSVDALLENNPRDSNNTSYVEDKGRIFAVCLREKQSGQNRLHNFSLLQYVVLHELAHLSMEEYGHNDKFWTNFKLLLEDANDSGAYKPVDYKRNPVNYCHLDITYSPFFDDSYSEPVNWKA